MFIIIFIIIIICPLVRRVFASILETNHIYMVYNVAAILWLRFVVRVMLFPVINELYCRLYCYISTSPSMCPLASLVFCGSLMS